MGSPVTHRILTRIIVQEQIHPARLELPEPIRQELQVPVEQIHQEQRVLPERVDQEATEPREQRIAHFRTRLHMIAPELLVTRAAVPLALHQQVEELDPPMEMEAVVLAMFRVLPRQAQQEQVKQKEKKIILLHLAHETRTINKVEQIGKVVFWKCRCVVPHLYFFIMPSIALCREHIHFVLSSPTRNDGHD
jgi:hypothetical protein